MESIKRLREYVREHTSGEWAYATYPPKYPLVNCADVDLYDITDAIEQEHARLLNDAVNKAHEDGERSAMKQIRTSSADYQHGYKEAMSKVEGEYVKLPVDAEGVPIRIGDVMEWVDIEGTVEVVCTVDAVGVDCFFAWDAANCRYAQKHANAYRHHHAPTVEDVLREFVERLDEIGSEDDCVGVDEQECRASIRRDIAAAYAEFAAKLQLKEG